MKRVRITTRAVMALCAGAAACLIMGGCGRPKPGAVAAVDLGGGLMLEMVWVPGAKFEMGSPETEPGHSVDETPMHRVKVDGFWIGKYEVTQEQYEKAMGANPSNFPGAGNPVDSVTWNDAMEFCRRVSDLAGTTFTLPTEAQWELACRAKTQTRYFFGEAEEEVGEYAWYSPNSGATTHPVGEKKPNPLGLYDMYGNVWEWCRDWYYGDYYEDCPILNPESLEPRDGRVLRGGSWLYGVRSCRSAARHSAEERFVGASIGFRVAAVGLRPTRK